MEVFYLSNSFLFGPPLTWVAAKPPRFPFLRSSSSARVLAVFLGPVQAFAGHRRLSTSTLLCCRLPPLEFHSRLRGARLFIFFGRVLACCANFSVLFFLSQVCFYLC